jgi:hypothetical protein
MRIWLERQRLRGLDRRLPPSCVCGRGCDCNSFGGEFSGILGVRSHLFGAHYEISMYTPSRLPRGKKAEPTLELGRLYDDVRWWWLWCYTRAWALKIICHSPHGQNVMALGTEAGRNAFHSPGYFSLMSHETDEMLCWRKERVAHRPAVQC